MLSGHGSRQGLRAVWQHFPDASIRTRRGLHYDGRNRLSNLWTPTQSPKTPPLQDVHDLLVRGGFLRQAQSGIFHLLPLGLRVQDKIERLIDKHMRPLGASKLSLSSLSSEDLWQRSGRLDKGRGSEFFRLEDRKGAKLLLSPTHEEEITAIVANTVHSHKQLPLRLYQVSRKYRDEARPRQGLLRGREFVMKDLYTFDATEEAALTTYEDVRKAYTAILDELQLPGYLVANASSGNMGGNLSHEYHFRSEFGEDTIIKCNGCDYSINEEIYIGQPAGEREVPLEIYLPACGTYFISKDRSRLLCVMHPAKLEVNLHAVKLLYPDIDPSISDPFTTWRAAKPTIPPSARKLTVLSDPRLPYDHEEALQTAKPHSTDDTQIEILPPTLHNTPILLTKARFGDLCPACRTAELELYKTVEIGHTFHLGTRYSEPLNLRITDAQNKQVPVHMGCHGIGVSRLIAAAAEKNVDRKGMNWPFAIAPFGVVILPIHPTATAADAEGLYDILGQAGLDPVIDDRENVGTGWKLQDADLVGYPFIVVLGKGWGERGEVEVQCRRIGFKRDLPVERMVETLEGFILGL